MFFMFYFWLCFQFLQCFSIFISVFTLRIVCVVGFFNKCMCCQIEEDVLFICLCFLSICMAFLMLHCVDSQGHCTKKVAGILKASQNVFVYDINYSRLKKAKFGQVWPTVLGTNKQPSNCQSILCILK